MSVVGIIILYTIKVTVYQRSFFIILSLISDLHLHLQAYHADQLCHSNYGCHLFYHQVHHQSSFQPDINFVICDFQFQTYIYIFKHIAQTNYATLIMSVVCIIILYTIKVHVNQRFKNKMKIPVPIELFVVS